MTQERFTIIDDGRDAAVEAAVEDGAVRLAPEAMSAALGWVLSAEGLCRDTVCVPVLPGAPLVRPDGIDLAELARILDRPLALDLDERVAYLGMSAHDRRSALRTLVAPDFTLPDLAERPHALSEHRGKKVLLVVYASW